MSTISPISNSFNYSGYNVSNGSAPEGSSGIARNPGESNVKSPGRKSSPAECETCKNRKYQDGSDEMVSFKSATHISPQAPFVPTSRSMLPMLIKKRRRITAKLFPPMSPSTLPYVRNAGAVTYPAGQHRRRSNILTKTILTRRI